MQQTKLFSTRHLLTLAALVSAGLGLGMGGVGQARAEAPVTVELNKLEPQVGATPACRAYMVAQNPDPVPLEQLRLDLVLFGTDGVIARRIAFDLGPLAPGKTAVRLFDLPGIGCDAIGRILVNDVLACRTGGATPADQDRGACLDRLAVSSRAAVPLVK